VLLDLDRTENSQPGCVLRHRFRAILACAAWTGSTIDVMSETPWFKRLIPRPGPQPTRGEAGPPTLVVDVDLYPGEAGPGSWTAEWGLLDEQMVDETTGNSLAALVERVLADARTRWGDRPDVTVQWTLHDGDGDGTDVTGAAIDDVILPVVLLP
jgi:hypothetical protein